LAFGRPFEKRFALCYHAVVCLSVCLSVCNDGLLWPNGWMDQHETWHAGRPPLWPHCVRWEPSFPFPKGSQPPIFDPYLLWPNSWLNGSLHTRCLHSSAFYPTLKADALQWFSISQTSPKVPLSARASTFPCNTCFLNPPGSAFQTASQTVQPFCIAHVIMCVKTRLTRD